MPVARAVEPRLNSYPFCIVWTPIPLLTWLLPFVGHMGIADSKGVTYDFAGPYDISEGDFAFGTPLKYIQMDPALAAAGDAGTPRGAVWDAAVRDANAVYRGRMHNLLCDNCHSHVAMALSLMKYQGSTAWNMVWLAAQLFFAGKYVSAGAVVWHWLPFAVICSVCVAVSLLAPPAGPGGGRGSR
ncbi:hypothetical protein FNF31_02102 [Cafeteria roenbergensis]|uniref:Transmembrane protein 222 n=1 Tax=Cafeteria roenbergensis TaxID=33653 RepID=A0A5A8DIY6_CAFRO|nr:hypothetical protein FNF31_02102 [Cafeteria roenbergensis]KAA0170189.1 hypothetical protein FNF28_01610 [Cafeteria roenbergensis]